MTSCSTHFLPIKSNPFNHLRHEVIKKRQTAVNLDTTGDTYESFLPYTAKEKCVPAASWPYKSFACVQGEKNSLFIIFVDSHFLQSRTNRFWREPQHLQVMNSNTKRLHSRTLQASARSLVLTWNESPDYAKSTVFSVSVCPAKYTHRLNLHPCAHTRTHRATCAISRLTSHTGSICLRLHSRLIP